MFLMQNEKKKKTNNDRNRTANLGKNQNTYRERKNNYLRILEAGTIKQTENKYVSTPIIRYPGPFLKWTKEELRQMNQRTRKLMTIHMALHVSRKEGGTGLACIEDFVETLIRGLDNYQL